MANEQIKIGNVSFYKADIKDTSVVYKNGEKFNCVWLQNGTKMEFKDQKRDANAGVTTGYDSGNDGKYGTGFSNITGLYVEGSNGNDYYHVSNCEDYNIDVKDGRADEVRILQHGTAPGTVNADSADTVDFVDDSMINMNEGFFIRKE